MAWTDALSAEAKAEVEAKGWHTLEGDALAQALYASHSVLSKSVGDTAADTLRISDSISSDAARVKEFWSKLGAPTEPKGYDFTAIKFKDGTGLDEGFADATRRAAHAVNMPAPLLQRFLTEMTPFMEQQEAGNVAQEGANQVSNDGALLQAWKQEAGVNKIIVERAMNTLKEMIGQDMTPAVLALSKTADGGYVAVQNMMLALGKMLGEARYVGGGGQTGGTGRMSPEQAGAQREALMGDKNWVSRWMDGGVEERSQMENLITIIAGAR